MKYKEERKQKVIEKVKKGIPYRKVAKQHNIPKSTVWAWCKKAGITKAKSN